jgi:hypothetical protein
MVVARWEGALNLERAHAVLAATTEAESEEPEAVADAASVFELQVPDPSAQAQQRIPPDSCQPH